MPAPGTTLGSYHIESPIEVQKQRAKARGDTEIAEALGRENAAADAKVRDALTALEARARAGEFVNEVHIALLYLRLNEPDRALDWLERAYDTHNPNLPGINNRQPFDPLRSHPRFQALLRRMNLPQSRFATFGSSFDAFMPSCACARAKRAPMGNEVESGSAPAHVSR